MNSICLEERAKFPYPSVEYFFEKFLGEKPDLVQLEGNDIVVYSCLDLNIDKVWQFANKFGYFCQLVGVNIPKTNQYTFVFA